MRHILFALMAFVSSRALCEFVIPPKAQPVWLVPSFGTAITPGAWSSALSASYVLGLGLEWPLGRVVSAEAEGSFSPQTVEIYPASKFHEYALGGGLRLYPLPELTLRPFVAVGISGTFYEGLPDRSNGPYNHFQGALVSSIGAEWSLSRSFEIGVRGSWVNPCIGLPQVRRTADGVAYLDTIRILSSFKVSL